MSKVRTTIIGTLLVLPVVIALLLVIAARGIATAKKRANSATCANTVVSIGYGLRIWAEDNGGKLPGSFNVASNDLITPKLLVCPSDRKRPVAANWTDFTSANSSYELSSGNFDTSDTNTVILRCKIHGHLGYVDGTVFDGEKRRSKSP